MSLCITVMGGLDLKMGSGGDDGERHGRREQKRVDIQLSRIELETLSDFHHVKLT